MLLLPGCPPSQMMLNDKLDPKNRGAFGHTRDFEDVKNALALCQKRAKNTGVAGHDLIHLITWLLYNFDCNSFVIGGKLNELLTTLDADKKVPGFAWFYEQWGGLKISDWQAATPLNILKEIGKRLGEMSGIEIDDMINMLGGNQVTYNKARDYDFIERVLDFYKLGCPKVP